MRELFTGALVLFAVTAAAAGHPNRSGPYDFGSTPTSKELSQFFAIPPSGEGLPEGKGTVSEGAKIYARKCAACHGADLQGSDGQAGGPLVGGRGTFQSDEPVKTVESYWPYATTIFDYVKRAMPMDAPGSLTDRQIYSVVAFVLFRADVIPRNMVMDAESLPAIVMPNAKGFVADPSFKSLNPISGPRSP